MIPRFKPFIGMKEISNLLNMGMVSPVNNYEQRFAKLANSKNAIAFGYGRTALYVALKALEIKNKKIICPAYTCVVVAHAIKYSDNTPVFVDSTNHSYNMDNQKIYELVKQNPEDYGAVIFTSIFGEPVDLDFVKNFQKEFPHILIVQDCAHSFFCEWKGEQVQNFGDLAIYGLNVSKIIHSIFGGMLTCSNSEIYKKIKIYRDENLISPGIFKSVYRICYYIAIIVAFFPPIYTFVNFLDRKGCLGKLTKYYEDDQIDMPQDYLEKMDKPSARVGIAQLAKYKRIISTRKKCAEIYNKQLSNIPGIVLPNHIEGHTYSHYVVLVENREEFLKMFLDKGIQLGWLIEYSIPMMKAYGQAPLSEFPWTGKFAEQAINLPVYNIEFADAVVKKFQQLKS